jgi:hypothetical protein
MQFDHIKAYERACARDAAKKTTPTTREAEATPTEWLRHAAMKIHAAQGMVIDAHIALRNAKIPKNNPTHEKMEKLRDLLTELKKELTA